MIGIYKITNQETNEVYIGQSVHIAQRWRQHCLSSTTGHTQLYRAMQKYGLKNFSFEVIEECMPEELNEREVYWIAYYDSFHHGYNMTPGGTEPIYADPQEIYSLWDEGLSIGEIADKLSDKISYGTVKNYLHDYENWNVTESRRRSGLLARYGKGENENENKDLLVIKQYTLFGDFISNWKSIKTVATTLSLTPNTISLALRGQQGQAGGFQWKMGLPEDTSSIEDIHTKVPNHFEIIQKDLQGNFIARYKTIKEASEAVHTSPNNIARVCKEEKNRKTAKGFKWEYDYDTWYDPN